MAVSILARTISCKANAARTQLCRSHSHEVVADFLIIRPAATLAFSFNVESEDSVYTNTAGAFYQPLRCARGVLLVLKARRY